VRDTAFPCLPCKKCSHKKESSCPHYHVTPPPCLSDQDIVIYPSSAHFPSWKISRPVQSLQSRSCTALLSRILGEACRQEGRTLQLTLIYPSLLRLEISAILIRSGKNYYYYHRSAMTAIRRKRDDDSTFHSASQCSGSLVLDASHSSMIALDTSTIGDDSSRPRHRRKRRRTNILEQLQQIDISNGEVGVPNQILEQAGLDDNSQTLTSSDSEDDGDSQILPPSDVEVAERMAMRDIVFGRPPVPPPPNPVDRKIQALVRKSLHNVQRGSHPLIFESNSITRSQDDMTIEPVYARPTDPSFFDRLATTPSAVATGRTVTRVSLPQPPSTTRRRSNSLPGGQLDDLGDEAMELS